VGDDVRFRLAEVFDRRFRAPTVVGAARVDRGADVGIRGVGDREEVPSSLVVVDAAESVLEECTPVSPRSFSRSVKSWWRTMRTGRSPPRRS
jgi:hypothetical protein